MMLAIGAIISLATVLFLAISDARINPFAGWLIADSLIFILAYTVTPALGLAWVALICFAHVIHAVRKHRSNYQTPTTRRYPWK